MPQIKRNFTAGKMNKDIDERLVPNGEYRDALNVEIRTTEGGADGIGDAGSVQNILGNSITSKVFNTYGVMADSSQVVGCIANEKTDCAYFMVAAPDAIGVGVKSATITNQTKYIDYIVEHNASTGVQMPVIVDHWATIDLASNVVQSSFPQSSDNWVLLKMTDDGLDGLRVGMFLEGFNEEGEVLFSGNIIKMYAVGDSAIFTSPFIELDRPNQFFNMYQAEAGGTPAQTGLKFIRAVAPRVLEFPRDSVITGINIIDDLLFWTDGVNEPKRINIKHCKAGSNLSETSGVLNTGINSTTHTKFFIQNPNSNIEDIISVSDLEVDQFSDNDNIKKEHITVIRKAPVTPPNIIMTETDRGEGQAQVFVQVPDDYAFVSSLPDSDVFIDDFKVGDFRTIYNPGFEDTIFRANDILVIRDLYPYLGDENEDPVVLKAKFIAYIDEQGFEVSEPSSRIKISMLFIHPDLVETITEWDISLQQKKPLFELKLGRFAYRYKYENNEYSTFSPFSEIAFLPGRYQYKSHEAYNLGMVNRARNITIKDFIPIAGHRPVDVKAVDILFKETNKPNVYIVKTINRGTDNEWVGFTPSQPSSDSLEELQDEVYDNGSFTLTSEAIHRSIESNQIIRVWDNVPRSARAQEITGNRIVYGNYLQNYNIPFPISLKQQITSFEIDVTQPPKKSVKSLRDYKWGIVFGDEYGRETPVISSSVISGNEDNYISSMGDISVDKELSITQNQFTLTQDWSSPFITGGEPPEYFKYAKYYVKETSNEYYNLVMDRWYLADTDDANNNRALWISFPSADRNKIDEESYLILKKRHGDDTPVHREKARYKVIAIENEAPDFIKTDHRKIGSINLEPSNGGYGTNGTIWSSTSGNAEETISPVNLLNNDWCRIGYNAWGGVLATGYQPSAAGAVMSPFERKGKIKARIVGTCDDTSEGFYGVIKSRWNTVTNWKYYGNYYTLYFKDKWGTDIDMRQRFLDMGFEDPAVSGKVDELTYALELKEEIIENKPEFDGRFFVKIQSDNIIQNDILVLSETDDTYFKIGGTDIAYIDNATTNQGADSTGARFGEASDDDSPTWWQGAFQDPSPDHNAEDYVSEDIRNFTPWKNNAGNNNPSSWVDVTYDVASDSNNPYNALADGADLNDTNINPWTPQSVAEGFGTGFWRNETRQFWINYLTYGSRFYIDGARAFELKIGGQNYDQVKPTSLDTGQIDPSSAFQCSDLTEYPTAGHMGRLSLGINKKNLGEMDAEANTFWSQMTEPGMIFRFTNEVDATTGEEVFYKVVAVENYSDERNVCIIPHLDQYNQNAYDDKLCQANDSSQNYLRRSGFRINFRRIDKATGLPTNNGLDPSNYDPRSHMRHDGSETVGIETYRRVTTGGDQLIVDNGEGASWETEPKEDSDLDIYYEASTAIPMKIEENNVHNFIPIDCGIEVTRRTDKGEVRVDLGYDTLSEHKVSNLVLKPTVDFSLTDESEMLESVGQIAPIIKITSKNQEGVVNAHARDIGVGDFISFKHPSGLITKSKITGHYKRSQLPFLDPQIATVLGIDMPFWETSTAQVQLSNTISWSTSLSFINFYALGMSVMANFQSGSYTEGMIITPVDPTIGFPTVNVIEELGYSNGVFTTNYVALFNWFTNTSNWPTDDDGSFLYGGSVVGGEISSYPAIPVNVADVTGWYSIDPDVWKYPVILPWHNCWSFGNGVESDRIRDDFNAPQIDNGVIASTTSADYKEDTVSSGLIHSGIYNSSSGVNELNQFNMGEKITKSLNPSYGSVQALKSRFDSLISFTEDKVLKILASKDALFNADGDSQLVSTNRVLGNVTPYVGDYGISKNPESLASDQYRMYFTDKQRGAVLRLSRDGLTPISEVGMKTWFRENLRDANKLIGSFDIVTGEYNLHVEKDTPSNSSTVSFNERSKGWPSFKSFLFQVGTSVNGKYFTAIHGLESADQGGLDGSMDNRGDMIYQHHNNTTRNNFYGTQYNSTIDVIINEQPGSIKSFRSVNYEGSQGAVVALGQSNESDVLGNTLTNIGDNEFYNLTAQSGWSVTSAVTDKDTGIIPEFIEKEGKWFNSLRGTTYAASGNDSLNSNDAFVQGLGIPTVESDTYS